MKIDPRLLDLKLIRKLTSPTLSDVHVDELLTEIVIGYPNAGFIAEEISPVVEVTGETGKYTKWGRENVDIPQTGRAPGADFKRKSLEPRVERCWGLPETNVFIQRNSEIPNGQHNQYQ